MNDETPQTVQLTNINNNGRTWADLVVMMAYGVAIVGGLALIGFFVYRVFGEIPLWLLGSIVGSFIFIPWLTERAKADARLFMVVDGPGRLTEYRIGSRVPIKIEGRGVEFWSQSGTSRTLLTYFDPVELSGEGSALAEYNQFEQVRDLNTVDILSSELQKHLKETRITKQTVGVEVEKKAAEVVDWSLKMIYGAIIPTEISEAFGIEEKEVEFELDDTIQDLVDDFE